jgi:hypothetical protein
MLAILDSQNDSQTRHHQRPGKLEAIVISIAARSAVRLRPALV